MRAALALCFCVLLGGCQKSSTPKVSPAPAASRPSAEVEMNISVKSDVQGARTVAFVTAEPCESERAGTAKFGMADALRDRPTFLEVFVPQGSRGYVCGATFDATGQMIGLGGADKNPLQMEGAGEVLFQPAVHVLALPTPRPAPAGLLAR